MEINSITNTGISGKEVKLSLVELIKLQTVMEKMFTKNGNKAHDIREFIKEDELDSKEYTIRLDRNAARKITKFLIKITEGIQTGQEADDALFSFENDTCNREVDNYPHEVGKIELN